MSDTRRPSGCKKYFITFSVMCDFFRTLDFHQKLRLTVDHGGGPSQPRTLLPSCIEVPQGVVRPPPMGQQGMRLASSTTT